MVYPSLHVDNQRVIWWLTSGFEGYCIFRPTSTTSLPQLSDQSVRAKRCHWANGRPVPKTTRLATTKPNLWLTATAGGSSQLLTPSYACHTVPMSLLQRDLNIFWHTHTQREGERETHVTVRKQKQAISKYHISDYIYTYYIFIYIYSMSDYVCVYQELWYVKKATLHPNTWVRQLRTSPSHVKQPLIAAVRVVGLFQVRIANSKASNAPWTKRRGGQVRVRWCQVTVGYRWHSCFQNLRSNMCVSRCFEI